MSNERRACIGIFIIIVVLFLLALYSLLYSSPDIAAPATPAPAGARP